MNTDETKGPGRPRRDATPADTQIQLRVTRERKGAYVKASRKNGTTLANWCFAHLDKAADYKPK